MTCPSLQYPSSICSYFHINVCLLLIKGEFWNDIPFNPWRSLLSYYVLMIFVLYEHIQGSIKLEVPFKCVSFSSKYLVCAFSGMAWRDIPSMGSWAWLCCVTQHSKSGFQETQKGPFKGNFYFFSNWDFIIIYPGIIQIHNSMLKIAIKAHMTRMQRRFLVFNP